MTAAESSASSAPPPAWTQRPASLASALASELVQRIVRGEHPPGSSLPSEPALCEAYSVSRTVVREAVKMLQEKGLVQVRQGSGTTVTSPTMWNMLDELVLSATIALEESLDILDDLVVTRRLLESDMAYMAAQLADAEAVQRMRELVDEMDRLVQDRDAYLRHDLAFHDLIMQTSGNRLARAVVRALESQVVNSARYMGRVEPALCMASNRGHRRISERIAAADPAGASAAMFDHITEAWVVRRTGHGTPQRLQR